MNTLSYNATKTTPPAAIHTGAYSIKVLMYQKVTEV